ncbi:SpaH/EbpB family LPXTG-anchored major pilin [Schaalia suimastitidis]|uniref:SpaH/EbpB family LPXTG-anchored major pilin n=1 Tax=Schaalia suimastitidis TaxID=121163 RepID=UPI00040BB8FD|nr:SpaH/EbpB family LPXTG-anchored major pilin [Schaalia suimastitidis]
MSTTMMRRSLGILVAAALAAGMVTLPSAALALPAGPGVVAADPANPDLTLINPTATSVLNVHKHTQTESNGQVAADGLEKNDVEGAPIQGVEFTAQKLKYDLTTQQGWQELAALNGSATEAAKNLDATFTAKKVVTNAAGLAKFDAMPVGAYLVTETKTPIDVTPAEPFVVTLPLTNPDANTTAKWLYDVHVYPKNAVTKAEKTVSDAETPAVGHKMTYTIKNDIPKIDYAGGARLKNYQIVDPLDARLKLTDGTNEVTVVMEGTGAVTLTRDTDYKVVAKEVDGKTYVTVHFLTPGLDKIAQARANGDTSTKVVVTITPTIVAQPENGSGVIQNTAYLIPNDPSGTWNFDPQNPDNPTPNTPWDPENPTPQVPGKPTPPIVSKFGKVTITKTGTDSKTPITYKGAEFQVYRCTVPDGAQQGTPAKGATLVDADTAADGTQPLTVDGKTTFTTGDDGTVTINGLRNNDWVDGKEKNPLSNSDWYCLVETKAPTGYELQANPIPFQVLQTNASDVNAFKLGVTVTDVPSNAGFRLPLTGANGVIVMTIAGGLLVAGGGALFFVNRRKRHA